MSIFSKILSVLGLGQASAATTTPTTPPVGMPPARPAAAPPVAPVSIAVREVDVAAVLDSRAHDHAEKLNWKTSIVDLLKLLGIDSSLDNRKQLATELHCPTDKMHDSAAMNIWLHQAVLQKLAQNGGKIPADLLD